MQYFYLLYELLFENLGRLNVEVFVSLTDIELYIFKLVRNE